jgi:hypothetical protein
VLAIDLERALLGVGPSRNTIFLIGVLRHFHFKTDTPYLRTVTKSKTDRNVKVQDLTAKLDPEAIHHHHVMSGHFMAAVFARRKRVKK